MTHTEKLFKIYNRTYRNCVFYKEEHNEPALLNEIGVLRGIAYCIEEIVGEDKLFTVIAFSSFKEMIDEQNRLRVADATDCERSK